MSTNHIGRSPRNSFVLRPLPSRNVINDTSLSECYAVFVLYCNPAIPPETDTLDLKTLFKTPPKSDGKSFSIFTLYQLICKLESKEIKTWAELALELGVEPPDPAKGQSPQKVQQYAVRLKRWMHAMHVDAFFEYLRSQNHVYWSQLPTEDDPVPDERDGVPNEEDLALRALLPETRPKRGRKRAEEKDPDLTGEMGNAARRRRMESPPQAEPEPNRWSTDTPEAPSTADPVDARKMLEARLEAWAADDPDPLKGETHHRMSEPQISMASPSKFYQDRRLTHPIYRHPAGKSPNVDPFSPPTAESADSQETATRPRRKTGTVVSSAWRSSSATEGSKLRGRPPSNRNMSDGPYTTFSAIPELKTAQTASSVESPAQSSNAPTPRSELWSSAVANWDNTSMGTGGNGPLPPKLRQLPLPIPDRPINNGSPHYQQLTPSALPLNTPSPNGYTPSTTFAPPQWTPRATMDTHRQPSILTSYYNADGSVTNEPPITSSSSAPCSRPQLEIQDDTNIDAIELSYMQSILGAEWIDNNGNPAQAPDVDEAMRLMKTMLKCQRAEARDDNHFLIDVATVAGARLLNRGLQITRKGEDRSKTYYTSSWQLQYGSIQGSIHMDCWVPKRDTRRSSEDDTLDPGDPEELEARSTGTTVDWKKKYAELHQRTMKQSKKLRELKSTVLNGVLQAKDSI